MAKTDKPSLQMVVDGGRLVPAGPYEQEVLDTYRKGSVLTVDMHQRRSLPLLKKYWSVLGDVIANCKTPWQSKDEASDALKLALGVTDVGKTVHGKWFVRAGSISFNSMDEAAFRKFYDDAMMILAEVTGIDPDTLQERYRHLPESEPADAADHEGEPEAQAEDSGSPFDNEAADGQTAPSGSPSSPDDDDKAKIRRMLMQECIENMLRDATSEPKSGRAAKIDKGERVWKGELPDETAFVAKVAETARRLMENPGEKQKATDYLMAKVA